MATTAGALSQVSVGSTTASLLSAAATGGAAPYTYQWYRSTVPGFTPGGGNIIAGAIALALSDSGLVPSTTYYYKVIAIDSGAVASTSAQLVVVTAAATLSQNQFTITPYLGTVDQLLNYNTKQMQVDSSQAGSLVPGTAVKMIDSADGVPKVVACSANADVCMGFINYDLKSSVFVANSMVQVSQGGNVILLYATGAVSRGAQVQLDVSTMGGVAQAVGASGASIVGWALDKATAPGQLIRVNVTAPSFAVA